MNDHFLLKNIFRKLMPIANKTSLAIDDLTSSDKIFLDNKCNNKAVKRKVEDGNKNCLVQYKKCLLSEEKAPLKENQSKEISVNCTLQQVYSPPSLPDWIIGVHKKDIIETNQSDKHLFAVEDSKKVVHLNQLAILKSHKKDKKKVFNSREKEQANNVLFEFLTKGIDEEDINYLKYRYNSLTANDNFHYWLNETHWVNHPDILLIIT